MAENYGPLTSEELALLHKIRRRAGLHEMHGMMIEASEICHAQNIEISELKHKVNDLRQKYRSYKSDLKRALQTEKALQAIFTRIDNIDGKLGRPHE